MTINDQVGQRVRQIRKARKLTQVEVADRAGMNQATLSYLENGRYSPTIEALDRVAGALGVSLARVCDVGPRPRSSPREASAASSPFLAVPESRWVASNALAFAIRDAFPVNDGHTLVVPRRVVPTWFDAARDERIAIFDLVDQVKADLDVSHAPDGYNVGFNAGAAAGQTVMHLHVHVIPRYTGDMDDPRGGVRHAVAGRGYYDPDGGA